MRKFTVLSSLNIFYPCQQAHTSRVTGALNVLYLVDCPRCHCYCFHVYVRVLSEWLNAPLCSFNKVIILLYALTNATNYELPARSFCHLTSICPQDAAPSFSYGNPRNLKTNHPCSLSFSLTEPGTLQTHDCHSFCTSSVFF